MLIRLVLYAATSVVCVLIIPFCKLSYPILSFIGFDFYVYILLLPIYSAMLVKKVTMALLSTIVSATRYMTSTQCTISLWRLTKAYL